MRRSIVTLALSVLLASLFSASFAGAAGKAKEGWGPTRSFIGRYQAKILSGGSGGVRSAELTMFVQEEYPGSEEPAGILKFKTKTNNDVVYLKELKWRGKARTAVVKGGAFLGPTIGSFDGRLIKAGKIEATVSTRGLGKIKAVFSRYSKKPTP
jgi:hypothetical protein